jgi:hypothetical protein
MEVFLLKAKLLDVGLQNTFFMFYVMLFALGNFLPCLLWCAVDSMCLRKSHVLTSNNWVDI